jgi:hypothetical protein
MQQALLIGMQKLVDVGTEAKMITTMMMMMMYQGQ